METAEKIWYGENLHTTKLKGNVDMLPYKLVPARTSQDMWALGVMLYYALLTGERLFPVDRNEDLASPEAYCKLATWDDTKKKNTLQGIENPYAKRVANDVAIQGSQGSWLHCRCADPQVLEGRLKIGRVSVNN